MTISLAFLLLSSLPINVHAPENNDKATRDYGAYEITIDKDDITLIEGHTESNAPVTIVVNSETRVRDDVFADDSGHFSIEIDNLSGGLHSVTVIAGDKNRNEKADGPLDGGWRGFGEKSKTKTVGKGGKVSFSIPLTYDPFDIELSETTDSISRNYTLGGEELVSTKWIEDRVVWENYEVILDFEDFEWTNKFQNAAQETDGWEIEEDTATYYLAEYYAQNVLDRTTVEWEEVEHKSKRHDTYYAASNYATNNDLDGEIVSRPEIEYKAEWATWSDHSTELDTQSAAEDKKNSLQSQSGVRNVTIERFWNSRHDYILEKETEWFDEKLDSDNPYSDLTLVNTRKDECTEWDYKYKFEESYQCNPHDCNPYNCNPHDCNPHDCNCHEVCDTCTRSYPCNPHDCNCHSECDTCTTYYDCNPHDCNCHEVCETVTKCAYTTCWQEEECHEECDTCYDTCSSTYSCNCGEVCDTCYDTCYSSYECNCHEKCETCYDTCYDTCYETCYDTCTDTWWQDSYSSSVVSGNLVKTEKDECNNWTYDYKYEWVSGGHWEGGYDYRVEWEEGTHHSEWFDKKSEAGNAGQITDNRQVLSTGDWALEWDEATTKTGTYSEYQSAREHEEVQNVTFHVSSENGSGTLEYDSLDPWFRTEAFLDKSEAEQFAQNNGGEYATVIEKSGTLSVIKRRVENLVRRKKYEQEYEAGPWNSESVTVDVVSKNNYSGTVDLSEVSEGSMQVEIEHTPTYTPNDCNCHQVCDTTTRTYDCNPHECCHEECENTTVTYECNPHDCNCEEVCICSWGPNSWECDCDGRQCNSALYGCSHHEECDTCYDNCTKTVENCHQVCETCYDTCTETVEENCRQVCDACYNPKTVKVQPNPEMTGSTHTVEIIGTPSNPPQSRTVWSESKNYNLNLQSDKPSPETTTEILDTRQVKAPMPGSADLTILAKDNRTGETLGLNAMNVNGEQPFTGESGQTYPVPTGSYTLNPPQKFTMNGTKYELLKVDDTVTVDNGESATLTAYYQAEYELELGKKGPGTVEYQNHKTGETINQAAGDNYKVKFGNKVTLTAHPQGEWEKWTDGNPTSDYKSTRKSISFKIVKDETRIAHFKEGDGTDGEGSSNLGSSSELIGRTFYLCNSPGSISGDVKIYEYWDYDGVKVKIIRYIESNLAEDELSEQGAASDIIELINKGLGESITRGYMRTNSMGYTEDLENVTHTYKGYMLISMDESHTPISSGELSYSSPVPTPWVVEASNEKVLESFWNIVNDYNLDGHDDVDMGYMWGDPDEYVTDPGTPPSPPWPGSAKYDWKEYKKITTPEYER